MKRQLHNSSIKNKIPYLVNVEDRDYYIVYADNDTDAYDYIYYLYAGRKRVDPKEIYVFEATDEEIAEFSDNCYVVD